MSSACRKILLVILGTTLMTHSSAYALGKTSKDDLLVPVQHFKKTVSIKDCGADGVVCLEGVSEYSQEESLSLPDVMFVFSEALVKHKGTGEHKKGLQQLDEQFNIQKKNQLSNLDFKGR